MKGGDKNLVSMSNLQTKNVEKNDSIEKLKSDLGIEKDYLKKIVQNMEYNEIIYKYYNKLFSEVRVEAIKNKQERLADCNKIWVVDKYEEAKIKDFIGTNLCHDKFCNNCKKVKQAGRMAKFIPLLRPYKQDMYQLTLTVPNVPGIELEETIKRLFSCFPKLIEYLKGKKKIKGIDFEKLGYEGAIRSFEVTYKNNSYHPHIHALIVLKSDLSERTHHNPYSKDKTGKREERLFADEEILIQKIWRLLYDFEVERERKIKENQEKVKAERITKDKIENLKRGYSCTLDKFQEDDFIELFKYITKATDENDKVLTYKQFKVLYYALHNKRQIQGYGCFFGLKDDDEKISAEEIDAAYNQYLEVLRQKESPERLQETPQDLKKDKKYTLISRKRIYQHLKTIK